MPASTAPNWPHGLSDDEAITRLQSNLIAACEGRRDISADRDYRALRTALVKRPDLADVVPKFVRSHHDLTSMWAYFRKVSDKWQPRREHVWEAFKPLFERVEGKTAPPIPSSGWTGRRTAAQQAQIVLSLAPDALLAVDMLLEEQTRTLHNGGPVEPERADGIERLKELRDALSDLIELAQTGAPVGAKLATVKQLKDKAFKWSASPYGLALADMPLVASSTVLGCSVMYLVNLLTKGMAEAATIGAGAMALHGAAALQSRKRAEE